MGEQKDYGLELVVDIHACDPLLFTRSVMTDFMVLICELLDMKRCKLVFWDDHGLPLEECQTEPYLKGTTAVQFITTSNITIHALDLTGRVYLNIFSCKEFDVREALRFCAEFFDGEVVNSTLVRRV